MVVAPVIEYSIDTLPLPQSCVPSRRSCDSPPMGSTLGPNNVYNMPTEVAQEQLSCRDGLATAIIVVCEQSLKEVLCNV